jgi:hypothetical protein
LTGSDGEIACRRRAGARLSDQRPADGIALVDPYGHELAWIDELGDLPDELRSLVETELAQREFMPVITRIVSVASFATPSTWQVETDRGAATLILKGEEDIRRLTPPALLIADSHGIHFLILTVLRSIRIAGAFSTASCEAGRGHRFAAGQPIDAATLLPTMIPARLSVCLAAFFAPTRHLPVPGLTT